MLETRNGGNFPNNPKTLRALNLRDRNPICIALISLFLFCYCYYYDYCHYYYSSFEIVNSLHSQVLGWMWFAMVLNGAVLSIVIAGH